MFFMFVNKKSRRCDTRRLFEIFCERCLCSFRLRVGCSFGIYADELALAALVFKFYKTFDQSKERIVLAAAYVLAGLPFCTALTSQNVAAEDMLAAKFLKPKPLRVRIATVP